MSDASFNVFRTDASFNGRISVASDASFNGLLDVSGKAIFRSDVSINGFITPRYDSGWFSVAATTTYTLTHNLNLNTNLLQPLRFVLYFSYAASIPAISLGPYGTGNIVDMTGCSGYQVTNTTTIGVGIYPSINSIQLHTAQNIYGVLAVGSGYTRYTSGYLRLYLY
jgi:hypothetical protein